jgi:hypothetical protein
MTKKANGSAVLTAEDILRGGDAAIRQVAVPGLLKGGRPGMVYHRPVSAATMIRFQEEQEAAAETEKAGGNPHHIERMVAMLVEYLVTPDGAPMFTDEELRKAPADTLVAILQAITGVTKVPDPNALSEAVGSASPTDSLPS